MRRLIIVIICGLAWGVKAQSGNIVTDRPSQTDASLVIAPGTLQIESGFTFDNRWMDDGTTLNLYSWGTSWRVGLLRGLELRILTQPTLLQNRNNQEVLFSKAGMADLQAGFKWGILNQDGSGKTAIALVTHLITPTGTEGISINQTGAIAKVAVSHQLAERHSLNYNLGYEYLGLNDGEALYTLTWSISILEKLSVFIETYGRLPSFDEWTASADAGLAYLINPNLQVDYFFGTGLNHQMNFHALGISLRFGDK